MKILDESLRAPISMIKNDKLDILKYHEEKETIRLNRKQFLGQKERADAISMIKGLIDEWKIKPDEIIEDLIWSDGHYSIEIEEPYGPDYSEEALNYSIKVHDAFGFEYKCKECLVRAACCNFSNLKKLEKSGECDGINQLLDAGIIRDIEDFYLQKENENIT